MEIENDLEAQEIIYSLSLRLLTDLESGIPSYYNRAGMSMMIITNCLTSVASTIIKKEDEKEFIKVVSQIIKDVFSIGCGFCS